MSLYLGELAGRAVCGTPRTNLDWKLWLQSRAGHRCPCPNPFGCPACLQAMLDLLGADFPLRLDFLPDPSARPEPPERESGPAGLPMSQTPRRLMREEQEPAEPTIPPEPPALDDANPNESTRREVPDPTEPGPGSEAAPGRPLRERHWWEFPQTVVLLLYSQAPPDYLIGRVSTRFQVGEVWAPALAPSVALEPALTRLEGQPTFLLGPRERALTRVDRILAVSPRESLVRPRDAWALGGPVAGLEVHAGERLTLQGTAPFSGSFWLARDPQPRAEAPPGPDSLELPADLPAVVGELAARVAGGLSRPRARAEAVQRFLQTEFTYGLGHPFDPQRSRLEQFLQDRPPAHCEFFATAMAAMLRTQGIPSRYLSGFSVGPEQWDAAAEAYALRGCHAHAWVEAYLPGEGWATFDPTPPDSQPGRSSPEPDRPTENTAPRGPFAPVPAHLSTLEFERFLREKPAPGPLRRVLHRLLEQEPDGYEETCGVDGRRLMREILGRRCSLARALPRRGGTARLLLCVDLSRSCAEFCRDALRAALALQRVEQRILVYAHCNGFGVYHGCMQGGRPLERVNRELQAAGTGPEAAPALARAFQRAEVRRVVSLGDRDALPLWQALHRLYGPRFLWIEPGKTAGLARERVEGLWRWRCPVERLADALLRAR